jgi:MFS family permease
VRVARHTVITYRYDRLRALASGILEVAATIFLLLIVVRHFHAGPLAKAAVASAGSIGLLFTPWVVTCAQRSKTPPARAASRISAIGAVAFLVMALFPVLPVFVIGSMVALASSTAIVPLVTQIYQENYDSSDRGRRFARGMMIRIATAAAFSEVAGRVLSLHMDRFRVLLVIFAGACAFAGYCLGKCPSKPMVSARGSHPFRALRFVREDRLFRLTLIAWMFLGFAMLMMAPLRVEYLANPRYGVKWRGELLTAGTVALLTGVIPNIARLILNPVWGWLFDKMNFFVLRLILNLGLVAGILSFFISGSVEGLVAGAIIFGMASAGADVAWGLWVTKFAPADHVADYMSVHTFFTGLRGVIAPAVAFFFLGAFPLVALGWLSVGLIVTGSLFLLPEVRFGKGGRPAGEIVEKAPEAPDA